MIGDASGVNAALTKYVSQYKAEGNSNAIWSSFWTAMVVKALTGIALSLVAYFAAGPIAALIGKPQVTPYFQVASPLPFVWVTQVNLKSALLALGASRGYSILQIVNEVLLSFFPIVAVLMGFGAFGALLAMVIANYAYLAIGVAFCVTVVLSETKEGSRNIDFKNTLRTLLPFGVPLGFSNSYSTFTGQIANLVIARFVSLDLYGLYSVAQNASGLMTYVSDPITAMLLPAYSRISGIRDYDMMKKISDQTTRYEAAIILPVALFFVLFARPLVVLLFGAQYAEAGLLLTVMSAMWLAVGLGSDALGGFLTSKGYSKFMGGLSILGSSIGAIIAIACVPTIGLLGYLLVSLAAFLPTYLLLIRKAKQTLSLSPPFNAVPPFYYALVATGAICAPVVLLNLPAVVLVVTGLILLPILYTVFAVIFHALRETDPPLLRNLLLTQPLISAVLGPLISLLETIVRLGQRQQ
jgi:O-antigen/teichoic acid export membrane protein